MYMVDVRNSLFHGGATAEDGERLRGVDLRRFQSVFALRDAYWRLLTLLSKSKLLARQVKARRADLDSLMLSFEHSRIVRRVASDYSAIEDPADVKNLASVVLATLAERLSSADADTSDALASLVLTSIAPQVPSSYRVPDMQALLLSLSPSTLDSTVAKICSSIEANPGTRYEFYTCVINLAAHCSPIQVSAGYPALLGGACRSILSAIGPRALLEFGSRLDARE
ncbi:hypothetical protein KIPB_016287, partial [Kipferlia bialata]|eukprot:g16287.t1